MSCFTFPSKFAVLLVACFESLFETASALDLPLANAKVEAKVVKVTPLFAGSVLLERGNEFAKPLNATSMVKETAASLRAPVLAALFLAVPESPYGG